MLADLRVRRGGDEPEGPNVIGAPDTAVGQDMRIPGGTDPLVPVDG
jgi:hypothetical protein